MIDCTLKNVFDLNREHESNIDINKNEIIQSHDNESNFLLLKYISVLSDSKMIKKYRLFLYVNYNYNRNSIFNTSNLIWI